SSSDRAPLERLGNRAHEDLEVEPEREVLDVVVVPLDPVGDRRLPAKAVDLSPTGDAGFRAVAVVVAAHVLAEVLDVLGTLGSRTYQAHLALEDIHELRKLVERPLAEEGAHAGAPVEALDAARCEFRIELRLAVLDA